MIWKKRSSISEWPLHGSHVLSGLMNSLIRPDTVGILLSGFLLHNVH